MERERRKSLLATRHPKTARRAATIRGSFLVVSARETSHRHASPESQHLGFLCQIQPSSGAEPLRARLDGRSLPPQSCDHVPRRGSSTFTACGCGTMWAIPHVPSAELTPACVRSRCVCAYASACVCACVVCVCVCMWSHSMWSRRTCRSSSCPRSRRPAAPRPASPSPAACTARRR